MTPGHGMIHLVGTLSAGTVGDGIRGVLTHGVVRFTASTTGDIIPGVGIAGTDGIPVGTMAGITAGRTVEVMMALEVTGTTVQEGPEQ